MRTPKGHVGLLQSSLPVRDREPVYPRSGGKDYLLDRLYSGSSEVY